MFPTLLLCQKLQELNVKGKIEILGGRSLKEEVRARGFDVIDNEVRQTQRMLPKWVI